MAEVITIGGKPICSKPVRVKLIKLNTREDAEHPQPEEYPDGTEREGTLLGAIPIAINNSVYIAKTSGGVFVTSPLTEILEQTNEYITFKTRNSTYKLLINH